MQTSACTRREKRHRTRRHRDVIVTPVRIAFNEIARTLSDTRQNNNSSTVSNCSPRRALPSPPPCTDGPESSSPVGTNRQTQPTSPPPRRNSTRSTGLHRAKQARRLADSGLHAEAGTARARCMAGRCECVYSDCFRSHGGSTEHIAYNCDDSQQQSKNGSTSTSLPFSLYLCFLSPVA